MCKVDILSDLWCSSDLSSEEAIFFRTIKATHNRAESYVGVMGAAHHILGYKQWEAPAILWAGADLRRLGAEITSALLYKRICFDSLR
jgi:hypothetical protein